MSAILKYTDNPKQHRFSQRIMVSQDLKMYRILVYLKIKLFCKTLKGFSWEKVVQEWDFPTVTPHRSSASSTPLVLSGLTLLPSLSQALCGPHIFKFCMETHAEHMRHIFIWKTNTKTCLFKKKNLQFIYAVWLETRLQKWSVVFGDRFEFKVLIHHCCDPPDKFCALSPFYAHHDQKIQFVIKANVTCLRGSLQGNRITCSCGAPSDFQIKPHPNVMEITGGISWIWAGFGSWPIRKYCK